MNQLKMLMLFIQTTDTSNLVKKTHYNTTINEIENKINDHNHAKQNTNQKFSKLTSENFHSRLPQATLPSKNDIANFVKKHRI